MDITTFREDFPEFASETTYPDPQITFWSEIAEKRLIVSRWADLYAHGVELATAHYLTVAAKNAVSPGGAQGLQTSKSVGDVSASYDVQAISLKDGGQWNMTSYGRQFLELARLCGMGGYQCGVTDV